MDTVLKHTDIGSVNAGLLANVVKGTVQVRL